MAEERAFLRQRFKLVKQQLEGETHVERVVRVQLQREYRLLGKLLDEVPEGHVLATLQSWRTRLNEEWVAHGRRKQQVHALPHAPGRANGEAISSGAVITDKRGYK